MLSTMIRKEMLIHLVDRRFVSILVLTGVLAVLSVFTGLRNFSDRRREQNQVEADGRKWAKENIERGKVETIRRTGIPWMRPPQPLGVVVHGLQGELGRRVRIYHHTTPQLEDSQYSTDPVQSLFGMFGLGFIVQIILSLGVCLLIHDSVCGEKEAGTLRLYASFPVARSRIAAAKLIGSTVAVMAPFLICCLLVASVLAVSQRLDLAAQDWLRLGSVFIVYGLYLLAFCACGLLVSAACQRRLTAFLILLGLWAAWIFIIPNLALYLGRAIHPAGSYYAHELANYAKRWEVIKQSRKEIDAHWSGVDQEHFHDLPELARSEIWEGSREIWQSWDDRLYTFLRDARTHRRNRMKQQHALVSVIASISPLGASSFTAMDLARTGIIQEERLQDALDRYQAQFSRYLRGKWDPFPRESLYWTKDLSDFVWFGHEDDESVWGCLSRNIFHILNLALLCILGFAGAYVVLLRYDVR